MSVASPLSIEALEAELRAARRTIATLQGALKARMEPVPAPSELLSTVVCHAPVVLWATDRDGIFTLSEGRALAVLGFQPGQVNGQSVFELYRDQPQIIASIRGALRGEEAQITVKVDGVVFDSWVSPLRDELGAIVGVIGVATDVTASVRAEAAQRQIQDRFQRLFEASPAGIVLTEQATGRFLDINPAACLMLERTRDALIGRTTVELGLWKDPAFRHAAFESLFDPNGRPQVDYLVQVNASTVRDLHCFSQPIDVDGLPCLLTVVNDVTLTKQAERALQRMNEVLEERVQQRTEMLVQANHLLEEQIFERRRACKLLEETQARWRSLVEHAPDLILLVGREGQIEYLNHTQVRPELTVNDVVGHSVQEFVFPEYRERVLRDLERVFAEGTPVSHEVSGPDAAGRPLWFQSHMAPLWHHGVVVSATVVCRDVTAEHRAADELKEKQDLLAHAARVSMVGEMTAAMAHELNQPLAAIAHYVRGCIIRLQAASPLPAGVHDTLESTVEEAHRASEIIRRLRGFLQRSELQREFVSVAEILDDVRRLSEPALRNGATTCRIESPSSPLCIFADRIQMVQVLLNLVLNANEALRAVPESERHLRLTGRPAADGHVEFLVEDSGPGLPPHLGDSIFDAFVTTKADGLGLGLSITRSIVASHNGELTAHSAGGRGAVFTVRLPGKS